MANAYTTSTKRTDQLSTSDVVYLGLQLGFYRVTEIVALHGGSILRVELVNDETGGKATMAHNADTPVDVRN